MEKYRERRKFREIRYEENPGNVFRRIIPKPIHEIVSRDRYFLLAYITKLLCSLCPLENDLGQKTVKKTLNAFNAHVGITFYRLKQI